MVEPTASDSAGTVSPTSASRQSLVVGHDGSAGAGNALSIALQLASELEAPVTIVRAWSVATAPRPKTWKFGYVCSNDELAEAVHDELVGDTRELRSRFAAVEVTYRVYHTAPAECLIMSSENARMLVVGSRGRGGFSHLALGSISEQCVRHAHCPVLVTRMPPRPVDKPR